MGREEAPPLGFEQKLRGEVTPVAPNPNLGLKLELQLLPHNPAASAPSAHTSAATSYLSISPLAPAGAPLQFGAQSTCCLQALPSCSCNSSPAYRVAPGPGLGLGLELLPLQLLPRARVEPEAACAPYPGLEQGPSQSQVRGGGGGGQVHACRGHMVVGQVAGCEYRHHGGASGSGGWCRVPWREAGR